jgi:hypothetical protein
MKLSWKIIPDSIRDEVRRVSEEIMDYDLPCYKVSMNKNTFNMLCNETLEVDFSTYTDSTNIANASIWGILIEINQELSDYVVKAFTEPRFEEELEKERKIIRV